MKDRLKSLIRFLVAQLYWPVMNRLRDHQVESWQVGSKPGSGYAPSSGVAFMWAMMSSWGISHISADLEPMSKRHGSVGFVPLHAKQ